MAKQQKHTVRIIAGDYRSRLLEVVDRDGLRPTGNRMRETLFNWLQPFLYGACCLDLFAGSGALGLEALSRGAKAVAFNERDREAFQVLRKNVENICKEKDRFQLMNSDAIHYLSTNTEEFTLMFLDPPFGMPELLTQSVELINTMPIYQSVKYLVIERSIQIPTIQLDGFVLHREMKTKESNLSLFVRAS
ncbi:16S rRNA (guanine(966)-N(2))-methyltransferase RsmD [Wohlfahrtiimonas larvae]|uniref:Ribosomal RNA small subunit methyltransferase D n=1 Tax=Wohlfahrtiimonas larvae TaxID=1157986 RepID=A0ABP9MWT1_9GAMM|nr:16S rRNA (guanine(966)-N(2))-methyltransferase RsmD [Wohlfahrtiimonas larvae]